MIPMPPLPEIARSRVFDGLSDSDRQAWLDASAARALRRGQALARQGEPADALYLVESGALKLVQVTPEGHELIVRFVGPGEPFGGVVALDGASYPVTALAVEPMRLRAWPRDTLAALLARFPQVRVNLMREMTAHMTDALTRVREMATERVGQRLAHALLRLMRQAGRPTPDGILIQHPLTRQEFAELTGTTLYTVSRLLSRWQADGILASAGRRLIVRSRRRLEELTQPDAE
jgi:CRP-like cAMP-binding protein